MEKTPQPADNEEEGEVADDDDDNDEADDDNNDISDDDDADDDDNVVPSDDDDDTSENPCAGKKDGESVQSPDGCNTCVCEEGEIAGCTAMWCGDDDDEISCDCASDMDCALGDICVDCMCIHNGEECDYLPEGAMCETCVGDWEGDNCWCACKGGDCLVTCEECLVPDDCYEMLGEPVTDCYPARWACYDGACIEECGEPFCPYYCAMDCACYTDKMGCEIPVCRGYYECWIGDKKYEECPDGYSYLAAECLVQEAPHCDAIGTRSEGWYLGDKLITYANCTGCIAYCDGVDTDAQEGWYSSCDYKMFANDFCAPRWAYLDYYADPCLRHYCKKDSDCDEKRLCIQGECVTPDNPCEELHGVCILSADCPDGYGKAPMGGGIHCNYGGECCLIKCDSNSFCPHNLSCIDGLCL
ncbi:MAG: hypothetical protein Kow0090_00830 [Myxococcota bacterium]